MGNSASCNSMPSFQRTNILRHQWPVGLQVSFNNMPWCFLALLFFLIWVQFQKKCTLTVEICFLSLFKLWFCAALFQIVLVDPSPTRLTCPHVHMSTCPRPPRADSVLAFSRWTSRAALGGLAATVLVTLSQGGTSTSRVGPTRCF